MWDRFWRAALAVGGVAAIGAFVFWSLYQKWLSLPIFSKLSPDQTYVVMIIFLIFVFVALIFFVIAYLFRGKNVISAGNADSVFKLNDCWNGVNEIDCENLVGPDVTNAAKAMNITSSSWLNNLVDKKIIIENHFEDFETLYKELISCDKVVPGFEKKGQKCRDFISKEIKKAYLEMKKYRGEDKK